MNAYLNVMHTTTCSCAACAPVPTLGIGYKLISLFEEIYNYKATPEIQKLVDFKEFEKWYDIYRKRISAKATENAAKCAA